MTLQGVIALETGIMVGNTVQSLMGAPTTSRPTFIVVLRSLGTISWVFREEKLENMVNNVGVEWKI